MKKMLLARVKSSYAAIKSIATRQGGKPVTHPAPVPWLQSIQTRVTGAVLAIFLVGIWSLSHYASAMLRTDMQRVLGEQQLSTASSLARQIDRELEVRMASLKTVAHSMTPDQMAQPLSLAALLRERPVLESLFNAGVVVYDVHGTVLAVTPGAAARVGANDMDIDAVAQVLKDGALTVSPPVMGKQLRAPQFGITVPVRDAVGQVIGALSGLTHLGRSNFLDEIMDSGYGASGGFMLVARQQRLVAAATDKRRVMEQLPAPGRIPLVDRFIQGEEGSGVAVNPQGVEVLVSAKMVPLAGWYLAAALPAAQAFAPVRDMQRHMRVATLLLTVLAGGLTWWILRRQLAPMLAAARTLTTMSQSEQPVAPLPIARPDEIGQLIGGFNHLFAHLAERKEALKQSERKLSDILENVDSSIYLKDRQGRYLFCNGAMLRLMGKSMQEIVGHSDAVLFDPASTAVLRANDRRVLDQGEVLRTDEVNLRLFNGRTLSVLSVKLPLRDAAGEIYALCGISTDITERRQEEDERRIAAIAFECQEGMAVLGADQRILRVNRVFTQITGYAQEEVQGQTPALLCSEREAADLHLDIGRQIRRTGGWHGQVWLRRKGGEDFPARVTVTAVRNGANAITHYVGHLTDATQSQLREQARLAEEAAHRDALVREVHHRIKNNLQGITGVLRRFAHQHPEIAEPINQAIGQVQGISVIHGLRGRANPSSVQLCELTGAIAAEVSALWRTPVQVDIPSSWEACTLVEQEAVPMALVLNELILNAVKHGGNAHGDTRVSLRKGESPQEVYITISNTGTLPAPHGQASLSEVGLKLVKSLMPRHGAQLAQWQTAGQVLTELHVGPPVIHLKKDPPR